MLLHTHTHTLTDTDNVLQDQCFRLCVGPLLDSPRNINWWNVYSRVSIWVYFHECLSPTESPLLDIFKWQTPLGHRDSGKNLMCDETLILSCCCWCQCFHLQIKPSQRYKFIINMLLSISKVWPTAIWDFTVTVSQSFSACSSRVRWENSCCFHVCSVNLALQSGDGYLRLDWKLETGDLIINIWFV